MLFKLPTPVALLEVKLLILDFLKSKYTQTVQWAKEM